MKDAPLVFHERLYVLRIWIDEQGRWRASIKNQRTRQARYFGTIAGLIRFIKDTASDRDG